LFSFPYVTTLRELKEEFVKRNKGNVRERARKYLLENFGYDIDESIGVSVDNEPNIGHYRHHKSLYFEGIVGELLSQELGLENGTMTYMRDQYDDRNYSKKAIIEITKIENGSEKREKIGDAHNSQVLSNIATHDGNTIYSYHFELLNKYGYSPPAGDVSEVFSDFLASALQHLPSKQISKHFQLVFVVEKEERNGEKILVRKPYFFKKKYFKNKENGKEIPLEEMVSLAKQGNAYPSAGTYYRHLLLFMPGIMFPQHAQIVTPFEEDDEKIKKAAAEGVKRVKEITGECPLWIVTPNFENPYMYIMRDKDELSEEIKIPKMDDNSNLYKVADEIGKKLMKHVGNSKRS